MRRFRIEHRTVYRYARPVSFGPHRLLLRPSGPHVRVVASSLRTHPRAALRWTEDALGNRVALASFEERARTLSIESVVDVEHRGGDGPPAPIAPAGELLPVAYPQSELPDLARSIERHVADPRGVVDTWARRFLRRDGPTRTLDALEAIAGAIHDEMRWEPREEEGTQRPDETLARGVGACRDFALLATEACRSLGLAARLVSGYLYDATRDRSEPPASGGATHAWAQVYVPGPGWIEMDPTHGTIGNTNLVRVGVGREPEALAPIRGTWIGFPRDAQGMEVYVHVRSLDRPAEESGARPIPLPSVEPAPAPAEEELTSSARSA